jgi:hypothetical protein
MLKIDNPASKAIPMPTDAQIQKPVASVSRAELQARLHAKLDQFKSKRDITSQNPKAQKRKEQRLRKKEQRKAKKVTEKQKKDATAAAAAAAPVVVSEGRQIFSKFDFGSEPGKLETKEKCNTPKNPKQALERAKARAGRLETLMKTDKSKAAELARSEAWAKAIQKAQGLVIKDDVKLLSKAVHKMEKAKEKRAERWEERDQAVKDGQAARQKKRADNIQARKDQKKSGGGKSKGKRPGFEGSHFKKIQKTKKNK